MLLKIILTMCGWSVCVLSSGIFHESSKVVFEPNMEAEFFGYSVILNLHGLIVGAPKSRNLFMSNDATGQVFNCSLTNLELKSSSCSALPRKMSLSRGLGKDFYRDDMWLGATIASVADDKILICAPRSTRKNYEELLANGDCYIWSSERDVVLKTLSDGTSQMFLSDGTRSVYNIITENSKYLSFFAFGQAGMSTKIVSNDTFIIGAPGLMQWAGGIVHYFKDGNKFRRGDVTNTFYTKDLDPDDYFGYSVESGVFQRGGKTLIVGGAPRSGKGYGQVLIINQDRWLYEKDPLDVVVRIRGPQLGAYFGASLCCMDIDGDGVSDLLVGAPNYVKKEKDGSLPFDQGAVFIYLSKPTASLRMELTGEVTGSGASGARFGSAISGLGDVDGDGFNDVAIAAPWENDGSGAVYIYKGSSKGLQGRYIQRLVAEGTSSFGISLSNAMDVDHNHCNDLAIGAAKSSLVYLYRCVPTIKVYSLIVSPNVLNIPSNVTSFSASFCVIVEDQPLWPSVKVDLKTRIEIDPNEKRAEISGATESRITVTPKFNKCIERTINIKPTADLWKPISMEYILEPDELLKLDSTVFNIDAARVSKESILHSSHPIQLTRDCGDNKFCAPWLVMTLTPFDDPYIPGASGKLGAILTIMNIAKEPAYGTKVNITLPASPKRLPSSCTIEDLVITCDVPAPLLETEKVSWEIDLEYKYIQDTELKMVAEIYDSFNRNITDKAVQELTIQITPETSFNVIGKPLPNDTIAVPTKFANIGFSKVYYSDDVLFTHHFEITNFGPSDVLSLGVNITLPEMVRFAGPIRGCELNSSTVMLCYWYISSRDTKTVDLPLQLDLATCGDVLLEKTILNVTTKIALDALKGNTTAEIMTTFLLDSPLIWPIIVGAVSGLILLCILIYIMHRMGFFSRPKREGFKKLAEQTQPGTSSASHNAPVESSPSDDHNIDTD